MQKAKRLRKMKKMMTVVLLGVTLFSIGCAGQASGTPSPTPTPSPSSTPSPKVMKWSTPPAMQIDTTKKYYATMEVVQGKTNMGKFKIQLFANETPKTVNNFVFLAKQGYYDGVIFHRIIKAFMIQTGDPTGTGSGGPGYKFADELPVKHSYEPGIVAMANAGPNTNGSQFFVCTGARSANLNSYPDYTQFGKVVEGMDVVQKIATVEVVMGSGGDRVASKPVDPPIMKTVTITEE